jgi:glucose-6-phosphate isomerase
MSNVKTECYAHLKRQQESLKSHSLRRLFEENEKRASLFSLELNGLYYDFSKNHITSETVKALCQYAKVCKLPEEIESLLTGKIVNHTENRPALHSALRFQGQAATEEELQVSSVREKMAQCVEKLHTEQWLGFTGKPIKTVVNIGIGGSDLGPRMVVQALSPYKKNINVRFAANIDGADLTDTLDTLHPETTLFIIASKTLTTLETLENALSARQWMLNNGCEESTLSQHFIAISTNIKGAQALGVSAENIFPMWDWVGGRYSLWSAIGLPIAISIGMDNFLELLAGAHDMDSHYRTAKMEQNLPIMAGLLTFWYGQFWNTKAHAVLPYAQRLSRLPSYLQQLDMESLGKSVKRNGSNVDYSTGNIIWGTEGSNGQHSFHQLLHQGTEIIPVDFITVNQPMSPLNDQHQHLQACCISQSQALLKGKTLTDAEKELRDQGLEEATIKMLAPHKVVAGNKPSSTLVLEALTPKNLGSLIAFYEHKVHTLSVLLDINPFDQWGVEIGKQLGKPIHKSLCEGVIPSHWDDSTKTLIKRLSPQD